MPSAATAALTVIISGAYLVLAAATGLTAAPIGIGLLLISLAGAVAMLAAAGSRGRPAG